MITKTKLKDFSISGNYPYFPILDIGPEEKITARQRSKLTELIYTKVSDAEAVEDWLKQINDFSYEDARKGIRDLTESKWQ